MSCYFIFPVDSKRNVYMELKDVTPNDNVAAIEDRLNQIMGYGYVECYENRTKNTNDIDGNSIDMNMISR